jgi:predicted lactoylglutathione lyase
MKPRRIRIERAPVAIASNGALVLNLGFVKEGNLDQLVTFAREVGGRVFVGLVVEGKYRDTLVRDIDDASFDMALRLGADVVEGKRPGTRKKAPGKAPR